MDRQNSHSNADIVSKELLEESLDAATVLQKPNLLLEKRPSLTSNKADEGSYTKLIKKLSSIDMNDETEMNPELGNISALEHRSVTSLRKSIADLKVKSLVNLISEDESESEKESEQIEYKAQSKGSMPDIQLFVNEISSENIVTISVPKLSNDMPDIPIIVPSFDFPDETIVVSPRKGPEVVPFNDYKATTAMEIEKPAAEVKNVQEEDTWCFCLKLKKWGRINEDEEEEDD